VSDHTPPAASPLEGVTVLDLATFVAAPFCSTLLGEFGADVLKVERPGTGDDLRRLGHAPTDGPSYWWRAESLNKKSITCDLRRPEGQQLIKRLISQTDVVAENFRPGTLESWNLGFEDLAAINQAMVMVRISGFGQTGPYRDRPGFGRIAAAMSGISYISGHPDRPPVSPGTPTIPDCVAGLFGALGAMLALRHAEETGVGQVVDVALYESTLRMLAKLVPTYGATGLVRDRIGSATQYVVPHNRYQAPTADGWPSPAPTTACFAGWSTGRWAARSDRSLPDDGGSTCEPAEVDGAVQSWVESRSASDAIALLAAAEVLSSVVLSVADLAEDPHVGDRGAIIVREAEDGIRLLMAGIVPCLSATPGVVRELGPVPVSAHNRDIYCGRLGLSSDDVEALERSEVI